MLRFVAGAFFILHGLVHLLWFVVSWQITAIEGLPYSTAVLAGRIDLSQSGIRIAGLLWVVAALGWLAGGVGLIALAPWWQGLVVAVAVFSSILCVLALPVA